jgi:predicted nuclease of predicted toxin-antitoxin system
LKVVIDMNLSISWAAYLRERGHDAKHWTDIGTPDAEDLEIMEYCRKVDAIILSGDLDFTTIHAIEGSSKPSIIQLRSKNRLPAGEGPLVARALTIGASNLALGAIVTISSTRMRVAKLPIASTDPR